MQSTNEPMFSQYSLIHIALGLIIYFIKIPLLLATLVYGSFLLVYNHAEGNRLVHKFVPMWPGCKRTDEYLPILGDVISFNAGWLTASAVDCWHASDENSKHWLEPHNGDVL